MFDISLSLAFVVCVVGWEKILEDISAVVNVVPQPVPINVGHLRLYPGVSKDPQSFWAAIPSLKAASGKTSWLKTWKCRLLSSNGTSLCPYFLLLHWVPLRTLFPSLPTCPDRKVSFRAAQSNISTCVFYQAECSAALKNSSIKNSFSLALKGKNDGMLMWWRSRSVLGTVGFLMEKLFHGLNSWNVPGRAQAVSCARFVFLAHVGVRQWRETPGL